MLSYSNITIDKACLTHDVCIFGTMDPYAVLTIEGNPYTTSIKLNEGKFPIWNHTFSFKNFKAGKFPVKVMHKQTEVASGFIEVPNEPYYKEDNLSFLLYHQDKKAGKIFVNIENGQKKEKSTSPINYSQNLGFMPTQAYNGYQTWNFSEHVNEGGVNFFNFDKKKNNQAEPEIVAIPTVQTYSAADNKYKQESLLKGSASEGRKQWNSSAFTSFNYNMGGSTFKKETNEPTAEANGQFNSFSFDQSGGAEKTDKPVELIPDYSDIEKETKTVIGSSKFMGLFEQPKVSKSSSDISMSKLAIGSPGKQKDDDAAPVASGFKAFQFE